MVEGDDDERMGMHRVLERDGGSSVDIFCGVWVVVVVEEDGVELLLLIATIFFLFQKDFLCVCLCGR